MSVSRERAYKQSNRVLKRLYESRHLYLLLAAPMAYFILFKYFAMFWLVIAFKKYNAFLGLAKSEWVGLRYFKAFINDPYFWNLLRNTVLLNLLMLVFYFPVPIILALMINDLNSKRLKKFIQSVTYLPYFLSTVVVCGFIFNLMAMDGPINNLIKSMNGTPIAFMVQPEWFRPIYIMSEIWQFSGWGSIIYLAALTGVDPQLYEAASIDGASRWKQLWKISLPSIAPVISIQFLLTVGRLITVGFEKILLLYNGATYSTADVISTYVYRRGLLNADYSYGAAISIFQAVIALTLVIVANRTSRKLGNTSLW
ncbi:MAG: ABC transporter permease [Christensenellales bacterium]